VAGNVDAGVQRDQRVERAQPRLDRPVPHDRRDADEQQIAGEHDAHVWEVNDCVGGAMGRAEVVDVRGAAADLERWGSDPAAGGS
jgi:hypothetical protein